MHIKSWCASENMWVQKFILNTNTANRELVLYWLGDNLTMAKIVAFYGLIIFDVQKLICTKNIMTNKFQICILFVFRLPLILWFFLLYVFTPTFRKTKKRNLLCDVNGVIWLRVSVIFGFQEIWSELNLIFFVKSR